MENGNRKTENGALRKILRWGFLFFLFAIFNFQFSIAQSRRVPLSGVVVDAQTRGSLPGSLISLTDSLGLLYHVVAGAGGIFTTNLREGAYDISASYMGYETSEGKIELTAPALRADTIFLHSGIAIEAIVKEAVALRTSLEGDTLIYNADAFKVTADADVGALLQKMPGIRVDGSGAVEAQGESVKKVLIDGREFFGEDVAAAIASLPAEAVKSIEVFDKLSDNAEFTGIDDGEGYKAINITTRESMRQAVLGQVSALYGAEPPDKGDKRWHHYGLAAGNITIFQGDAKISIGGTANNLNERHFTSDDILGAGENDGIANVGRFQANYIDSWGKKNQWKIDAMYRFNITDADDDRHIEREYFEDEGALYSNYYSNSLAHTVNQNHIFRARIDFKPNKFTELRIRPFVRFQSNKSNSAGIETYYPVDELATPIELANNNLNAGSALATGINANYRTRLGKAGRTISVFFNGIYNSSDRTGSSLYDKLGGIRDGERSLTGNSGYNLMGGVTYTEPLGAKSLLNFDYNVSYNYSDIDRRSYRRDETLSPPGYSTIADDDYSGVYNSGYLIHKFGPGYRLQLGKTTFAAGAFYQYSVLDGKTILPVKSESNPKFHNFTYSLMVNSKFGRGASLRVFLNSRTQNPSVTDLQDVVDISRSQNISKGNPELRPTYNNRLRARFIFPVAEKGRTFSMQLRFNYALNAIVPKTVSDSPGYQIEGTALVLNGVERYTQPVNMDGQWDIRFGVDYGFPLNFMRSNLNLTLSTTYSSLPSRLGKWTAADGLKWTTNRSGAFGIAGGFVLGSNISEKIDFRVGYSLSYNNVSNTSSKRSNSDYLQHAVTADFKFVLPLGFTIYGTMAFNGYSVLGGENYGLKGQNFFIANAGVGKKVFRDASGEVSIFINDIANRNVSFRRQAYAQWVQNEINSVIGRYIGLKFTWNIRFFGKNGSQNIANYNIDNHHDGGRGGGGRGGFF